MTYENSDNDFIEVFVATCDEEISDYIKKIGGKTIMTKSGHLRSTDRVSEAVEKIENEYKIFSDIVVIVQGDEPLVNEQMVSNSISPLLIDPGIEIVNLMTEITNPEEINSNDSVKVVVDINNLALYMSRSPIPHQKGGVEGFPYLKKVNVIAMRRGFLDYYASLEPSTLEIVESIGMLRLLEAGMKIKMVFSQTYTVSVDTPSDLKRAIELMKNDFWLEKYNHQNEK